MWRPIQRLRFHPSSRRLSWGTPHPPCPPAHGWLGGLPAALDRATSRLPSPAAIGCTRQVVPSAVAVEPTLHLPYMEFRAARSTDMGVLGSLLGRPRLPHRQRRPPA